MNRRDFLKAIGAGAALSAMPGCGGVSEAPRRDIGERPNIVFILADDLGYGDVSCLNPDSKIPTPNIDRLAKEGMIFTDAHAPSAVCTPTRYGVLTGRYCWRSNLKKGVLWGYSPCLIEPGRMTAASLLKKHGYGTACIGKWHLGLGSDEKTDYGKVLRPGPNDFGFDYFFGIPASLDMQPYLYVENDRAVKAPTEHIEGSPRPGFWRSGPVAPGFRHIEVLGRLTERAVGYIENHVRAEPNRPFFLYFALTAPHAPVLPTDFVKGKSRAGDYGDFVVQVDWTLGEVTRALEESGISKNTLIIVTSDNGPEDLTAPLAEEYGHRSSHHFRGMKRDMWDGGHREPFIARWPGKVKADSASDEVICLTDLTATCAAIVGEKLPENAAEDSYDILPALLGEKRKRAIREAVVHHSSKGHFAIRQGDWKLILCRGSGGNRYRKGPNVVKPDDPPGQLYNMAEDYSETNNLYLEHPKIVKRLTALLEKYKRQGYSRAL